MFAGSSLWRNNFFINIGLCIGYLLYIPTSAGRSSTEKLIYKEGSILCLQPSSDCLCSSYF